MAETSKSLLALVFVGWVGLFVFLLLFLNEKAENSSSSRTPSTTTTDSKAYDEGVFDDVDYSPESMGMWETVVPNDNGAAISENLGIHSINVGVLPSGKVLLTPGSSWRSVQDTSRNHDVFQDPPLSIKKLETMAAASETDLLNGLGQGNYPDRLNDPFRMSELEYYFKVQNNAGTYDPDTNEFFRIPHPKPVEDNRNSSRFEPTDLFCVGHLHLPDGNMLYAGGTQFYGPFFTGHRSTFVFDWVEDAETDWAAYDWTVMPENQHDAYENETVGESNTPWKFSGFMEEGKWYPTVIPLMDGTFVLMSGFRDLDPKVVEPNDDDDMHKYEITAVVEYFDYRKLPNQTDAWSYRDVKEVESSPFTTKLPDEWREGKVCKNSKDFDSYDEHPRVCETYEYDAFKLYPRAYLMPDGERIFFSRDGDFNSMGSDDVRHQRTVKYSYIMNVGKKRDGSDMTFERGPDLPRFAYNGGNSVRDPTDPNHVIITGGMPIQPGFFGPGHVQRGDARCNVKDPNFDIKLCNRELGFRATRGAISFRMPDKEEGLDGKVEWEMQDNDFLGDNHNAARTMHYTIILPTKQLLVIGGGNYWFGRGVNNPLLLTPLPGGGYDKGKYIAAHERSALYHSTANLLNDGRVFLMGSNPNRAVFVGEEDLGGEERAEGQKKYNPRSVVRDISFLPGGYFNEHIEKTDASEGMVAEIFSPPYLFIDGKRRANIEGITDVVDEKTIAGKTHFLIHSKQTMSLELTDIPTEDRCDGEFGSLVLIKLGALTHGWDAGQHLFDIDIDSDSLSYAESDDEKKTDGTLTFETPDAMEKQIFPAFYHLFYVDCMGKPTKAASVRFDDNVTKLLERAAPPS